MEKARSRILIVDDYESNMAMLTEILSPEYDILLAKDGSASEVGADVQKAVTIAVEDSVGVKVSAVNVHICGVILKSKPQPAADK